MDLDDYFSSGFHELTKDGSKGGYGPLHWQKRLFRQFCRNEVPNLCDLPTGLGKTSVIHIWLLALNWQMLEKLEKRLPTRLVYVVDRRTVVDQATAIAERIKKNLPALGLDEEWLSVSTLRGQFADNREWTRDPSRPAIIIGTVDMIGSRLLFSGYRSSFKVRPLDAGLLGQDTLLVLDEAHLSEPFAKLVRSLSDDGEFQRGQGRPMRVMCMSATVGNDDDDRFKLEPPDFDEETEKRWTARKRLFIDPAGDKKKAEAKIIATAEKHAADSSRVVVFVRQPEDARRIKKALAKKLGGDSVAVLTGTMRGLERDQLVDSAVLKRFLNGDEKSEHRSLKGKAVLVATSAGEVGIDLNADHMVCDATPLDSMIQRLGRVNRRGNGVAVVQVVATEPEKPKQGKKGTTAAHTYDTATAEAMQALAKLAMADEEAHNASPKALDELKKELGTQGMELASTPKPTTVALTDILLDAWSMTSITQKMPGRPAVAPWLRGLSADAPQTTIAWRAELDLVRDSEIDVEALGKVFEKHRIRPHETLTVRTDHALAFLKEAVKKRPLVSDAHALVIGGEGELTTVGALTDDPALLTGDPTLILPASFGGLDRSGMLDSDFVPAEGDDAPYLDVADVERYERNAEDPPRLRFLVERNDDAWEAKALPGAAVPEAVQDLREDLRPLLEAIKTALNRNLRLCQPFGTDEEGIVNRYLLSLYPTGRRKQASEQPLDQHVAAVEKCAGQIEARLGLREPFLSALKSSATYHDEGKTTGTWQGAAGNKGSQPLGKSAGKMNIQRLRGYRHEFGSLLRITDASCPFPGLPADPEARDLMLHLIAVHHGRGRPSFERADDVDYADRARCPGVAVDVMRRFAHLQRKYGYWQLAWLENLLRCADAMASAENEEEET
jgi:CRISPR-associated endonuclease/helicase Cas3